MINRFAMSRQNRDINISAVSIFDGVYQNSVKYGTVPSSCSEFVFYLTGTSFILTLTREIAAPNNYANYCSVYVNDVLFITVTTNSGVPQTVDGLQLGTKKISIKTGVLFISSGIKSTSHILDLTVDSIYSIGRQNLSEKFIIHGDSIAVGLYSTNPTRESFNALFAKDRPTAILGYASGQIKDFAETREKIDALLSHVQELVAGVTGEIKYICELGTNDYGISGTDVLTFIGWYTDMISAMISAFPTLDIWCISPFRRSGDPTLLATYRTAIESMCTELGCGYINGYDALPLNLAYYASDYIHLTDLGHATVYNNINSNLY